MVSLKRHCKQSVLPLRMARREAAQCTPEKRMGKPRRVPPVTSKATYGDRRSAFPFPWKRRIHLLPPRGGRYEAVAPCHDACGPRSVNYEEAAARFFHKAPGCACPCIRALYGLSFHGKKRGFSVHAGPGVYCRGAATSPCTRRSARARSTAAAEPSYNRARRSRTKTAISVATEASSSV